MNFDIMGEQIHYIKSHNKTQRKETRKEKQWHSWEEL